MSEKPKGKKNDGVISGSDTGTMKDRWDLLPLDVIEQIVKILTYGAKKYEPNNWQNVPTDSHFAAMLRHVVKWRSGEIKDKESGLDHLAHALCDLVFVYWQELNKIRYI